LKHASGYLCPFAPFWQYFFGRAQPVAAGVSRRITEMGHIFNCHLSIKFRFSPPPPASTNPDGVVNLGCSTMFDASARSPRLSDNKKLALISVD
jgi:hypothetical protein